MKQQPIVTKEWLIKELDMSNPRVQHVVGRALVALFERQTNEEKVNNITAQDNGVGFTGADAYSGSLGAKTYRKYGYFPQAWMVERWVKRNSRGVPRLAKYAKQLDDIARAKQLPSASEVH